MPDERPSRIRIRALREYETLSATVAELERATRELIERGRPAVDQALASATKLLQELAAYVDLEQFLILPAVRNADVWGDLRAEALERRHAARRAELNALRPDPPRTLDPRELAEDLAAFTDRLRETLEHEKEHVLNPDVLRDDVVETEPD